MVFVRANIVTAAAQNLAKAATIAVRYCAARRQTRAEGAARETQVRDCWQRWPHTC